MLVAGILEVHAPGMANPCIIPLPNDPAAPTSAVHPSAAPASAFAGGQLGVLREEDKDAAYGGVDSRMGTGLRRTGSTSSFGSLDGSFTGSVMSQSGMFLCCLRNLGACKCRLQHGFCILLDQAGTVK